MCLNDYLILFFHQYSNNILLLIIYLSLFQIQVYLFNIKSILQCRVYCNEMQNSKRVPWYLLSLTIYVIWNMKQKLWYHTGIYFCFCQNCYNVAAKLQLPNQVCAKARYLICMHDTREEEINLSEYNQYIYNGNNSQNKSYYFYTTRV